MQRIVVFGEREVQDDVKTISESMKLDAATTNFLRVKMQVISGLDTRDLDEVLMELQAYENKMPSLAKLMLERTVLSKFAKACGEGGATVDTPNDKYMARWDWDSFVHVIVMAKPKLEVLDLYIRQH